MLDFFNFRKKRRQEQELRDKLFIESMSAINYNQVQTIAIVAQTALKIYEDHLIAKAKIAKLRNEAEKLWEMNEGR